MKKYFALSQSVLIGFGKVFLHYAQMPTTCYVRRANRIGSVATKRPCSNRNGQTGCYSCCYQTSPLGQTTARMEDESVQDGKPKASDSPDTSGQRSRNSANDEAANDGAADAASQERSKTSDATRAKSNAVASLLPDDNSILFGRGKSCNNHKGNIKMRRIINRYKDEYQMSVRGEKYQLVLRVYGELVDAGMKFLKPTDGQDGWMEVGVEAAIQKVGHALRNTRVGNTKKIPANIGGPRLASNGEAPGANARAAAVESSIAALTGTAQEQVARIPHFSSSSMLLGTGSRQSGGLVDAGELVQHSSAAGPIGALQGQLAASQGLTALSNPLGNSALTGSTLLPQGSIGIGGNSGLNSFLALENYRRAVELQRLRLALSMPVGQATLPGALPALSPNQLYGHQVNRDDQLRQLLLQNELSRNSGESSGQSEGKRPGPFNQDGHH